MKGLVSALLGRPSRRHVTRTVLAVCCIHVGLAVAGPSLAPGLVSTETRSYAKRYLFAPAHDAPDSWYAMLPARRYALENGGEGLYRHVFFEQKRKFQYPTSAFLFVEPVLAMVPSVADPPALHRILNLYLLYPFVLISIAGCVGIFGRSWIQYGRGAPSLLGLGCAALVAVFFFPGERAYFLGQIQTVLNALLVLSLLGWCLGMRLVPGLLVGLACLVKPHLGVVLIWGLARRQWAFVLSATLLGLGGVIGACSLYGWRNFVEYFEVVRFISQRGESFHMNNSFNGLMNGILGNGYIHDFSFTSFAPYHPTVHAVTIASSVLLLGVMLFRPQHPTHRAGPIDYSVALATAVLASPIAWEHHYGPLIGIISLLLPVVAERRSLGGTAILLVSLLLIGHRFVLFEVWGESFALAYFYRLLGGLLLLGLLCRLGLENGRGKSIDPSLERDSPLATGRLPPSLDASGVATTVARPLPSLAVDPVSG